MVMKMAKHHARTKIDEIAAAWVASADSGNLSAAEQREMDAWLDADPRHFGAWVRARATLAYFDRAPALGKQYEPAQFIAAPQQVPRSPSRRRFLWLTGTGIAAGLTGFTLIRTMPGTRHVSTVLGEVLRVPLEDGSAATLSSASEIAIEFDRDKRLVRLIRGVVLFEVVKALRPFMVTSGSTQVTATGTSFTVGKTTAAAIEVMVQEGSVDFVSNLLQPHPRTLHLNANTLAVADPGKPVEVKPLNPTVVHQRLAWRDGMISFDGDTLASAARQFRRFSDIHIVIDDPAIADKGIVGLYSATDPVGFAHAVATSMNLEVVRRGKTVHIRRARP